MKGSGFGVVPGDGVAAPGPEVGGDGPGSDGMVVRGPVLEAGEILPPPARAPKPSGCQRYVQRQIAAAMPGICSMLVARTMEGDLNALRLLLGMALQTGEMAGGSGRGGSGLARKMLTGFREWEARESGRKRDG